FLPAPDHPHYREVRRELLRVDLELSWRAGRHKRLGDYALLFPDLLEDRAAMHEVAFEEYRLRMLAGEAPSAAEYENQYGVSTADWTATKIVTAQPKSQGAIAQALLVQSVQRSNSEAAFLLGQALTALPEVGTKFLNFQLIAELGRGSFGRVYLARQGDLANRLVALKITVDLLGEEQKLAQLQHTNVVPIYSVHQAGPFQAVCMPYFGATTLAEIMRGLRIHAKLPDSGKGL